MGETLAETRLEVEARRADLQRTADELKARVRRAVDVRAKFRENPALFIGLGAGAVFLVLGGPIRVARLARRRLRPTNPEKAYDLLPKPLQSWVDGMVDKLGPRAEEARHAMAAELIRWRHDPVGNKKARKELAKQLAEGPPGPGRASWKALEAAAAVLSAALARKAVERFLSGEPPSGIGPLDAAGTIGGAAKPDDPTPMGSAAGETATRSAYAGISSRQR
ncbi:MAG: hypothetical protein M3Y88_03425 [Chloroflexota bacterium]|nr:hypothetical protein [Chloroflexota bacterium]